MTSLLRLGMIRGVSGSSEHGDPSATRLLLVLLGATTAARVGLAVLLGLSIDEAYTVTMARHLAASYFDHPPLMYWLAGGMARLSGGEAALAVRLPFILLFAGTTWLLDRLTTRLFGARAGFLAAIALNLVFIFTFNTALLVLPDGPLLFLSVAAVLVLTPALFAADANQVTPAGPLARRSWIGFGLLAGLALLSKYHGVFLLGGVLFFLLTSAAHRHWLRRIEPYLAVGVAAAVSSPVVVWNALYGWASFRFQGGRAAPVDVAGDTPFLDCLGGQAVFITPWMFLPLIAVFAIALWRGPREPRSWLLVCLAAGPVLGFNAVTALGGHALPHWSAPGFFFLLPLLASAAARRLDHGGSGTRWWLRGSVFASLILVVVLVSHALTGWVSRVVPRFRARHDPTLDLLEWTSVPERLREWNLPEAGMTLAGSRWSDAARLARVMGPGVTVTSVGEDPRGFELILDQQSLVGKDVLILASRRGIEREPVLAYAPFFERIVAVGSIPVSRAGRLELEVSVFLGKRLLRRIPFRRRI